MRLAFVYLDYTRFSFCGHYVSRSFFHLGTTQPALSFTCYYATAFLRYLGTMYPVFLLLENYASRHSFIRVLSGTMQPFYFILGIMHPVILILGYNMQPFSFL